MALSLEHHSWAIPRKNHVLSTVAEKFGAPFRAAANLLTSAFDEKAVTDPLKELYASRWQEPGSSVVRSAAELSAWTLAASWIVGVATRSIRNEATLGEAESWLWAGQPPSALSANLPQRVRETAEEALRSMPSLNRLGELLPYVLDPHGPGSRLSVRRRPATAEARARKRAEGVFYTPQDVADYMVSQTLRELSDAAQPLTFFDPACGTGVFLRSALHHLRRHSPQGDSFDIACSSLYGVDVDPWALDATAFVLLHACMPDVAQRRIAPIAAWHAIRSNLARVHALRLDPPNSQLKAALVGERHELRSQLSSGVVPRDVVGGDAARGCIPINQLFPELMSGPRVVVGNPPYADVGDQYQLLELSQRFATLGAPTQAANLYPLFLEQMIRLSAADAHGGAMVLPLSIACNSGHQFRATRSLISRTPGLWRFAFFDREPHALFGEDVKTRNAIVLWSKGASDSEVAICTGPLQKWRAERRAQMLREIQFTAIATDIRAGIPKVHGSNQATALEVLAGCERTLERAVLTIERSTLRESEASDGCTVHVGATAYNFLNVFLAPRIPSERKQETLTENPVHALRCSTTSQALALFAALNSRLAFWWWHINGDGFHVSRGTLASFPIGAALVDAQSERELTDLGDRLWGNMSLQPILSVNRGRLSMGFSAAACKETVSAIDTVLIRTCGIRADFGSSLERFAYSITGAHSLESDSSH